MPKYSLVGQDGNAYALMGYTQRALKNEGLGDLCKEMLDNAMSGDYYHLIAVCDEYLERTNEVAYENGYDEDDD